MQKLLKEISDRLRAFVDQRDDVGLVLGSPAAEAAPLLCAGITTFNALRHSVAKPGDLVAVQGLGGLGHLGIQFANRFGFRTVAVSRGKDKERLARELGVGETVGTVLEVELLDAKAGDTVAVEAASARWSANADEIADFLSGANPDNWPRQTLRSEMRHHLDLTLQEAQARLRGDWAADIAAYDTVHQHILGMADVLSAGIVKQYPRRFK